MTAFFLSVFLAWTAPAAWAKGHKASAKSPDASPSPSLSAASTEGAAADNYPPLLIGPGDELEIYVVNFSSGNGYMAGGGDAGLRSQLPTNYLVDSNGRILFPFLGEIQLQGLTEIQAGKLMIRELADYIRSPQVTVLVHSSNSYNVSVLGEVAHPGKFLIRGEPTVVSMIAEAGGPLQDANLGGALLIRGGNNKKEGVNLDHYLTDKGYQGQPPTLYPGDVLMVPKSGGIPLDAIALIASLLTSGAVLVTSVH